MKKEKINRILSIFMILIFICSNLAIASSHTEIGSDSSSEFVPLPNGWDYLNPNYELLNLDNIGNVDFTEFDKETDVSDIFNNPDLMEKLTGDQLGDLSEEQLLQSDNLNKVQDLNKLDSDVLNKVLIEKFELQPGVNVKFEDVVGATVSEDGILKHIGPDNTEYSINLSNFKDAVSITAVPEDLSNGQNAGFIITKGVQNIKVLSDQNLILDYSEEGYVQVKDTDGIGILKIKSVEGDNGGVTFKDGKLVLSEGTSIIPEGSHGLSFTSHEDETIIDISELNNNYQINIDGASNFDGNFHGMPIKGTNFDGNLVLTVPVDQSSDSIFVVKADKGEVDIGNDHYSGKFMTEYVGGENARVELFDKGSWAWIDSVQKKYENNGPPLVIAFKDNFGAKDLSVESLMTTRKEEQTAANELSKLKNRLSELDDEQILSEIKKILPSADIDVDDGKITIDGNSIDDTINSKLQQVSSQRTALKSSIDQWLQSNNADGKSLVIITKDGQKELVAGAHKSYSKHISDDDNIELEDWMEIPYIDENGYNLNKYTTALTDRSVLDKELTIADNVDDPSIFGKEYDILKQGYGYAVLDKNGNLVNGEQKYMIYKLTKLEEKTSIKVDTEFLFDQANLIYNKDGSIIAGIKIVFSKKSKLLVPVSEKLDTLNYFEVSKDSIRGTLKITTNKGVNFGVKDVQEQVKEWRDGRAQLLAKYGIGEKYLEEAKRDEIISLINKKKEELTNELRTNIENELKSEVKHFIELNNRNPTEQEIKDMQVNIVNSLSSDLTKKFANEQKKIIDFVENKIKIDKLSAAEVQGYYEELEAFNNDYINSVSQYLDSDSAEEFKTFTKATDLRIEGKYDQAIIEYGKLDSNSAREQLRDIYFETGHSSKAIEINDDLISRYSKLIAEDPTSTNNYIKLKDAYISSGDKEQAKIILNDFKNKFQGSSNEAEINTFVDAEIKRIDAVIKGDDQVTQLIDLANSYSEDKKYGDARTTYLKSIDLLNEKSRESMYTKDTSKYFSNLFSGIGNTYLKEENFDDAIANFKQSVKFDSNNLEAKELLDFTQNYVSEVNKIENINQAQKIVDYFVITKAESPLINVDEAIQKIELLNLDKKDKEKFIAGLKQVNENTETYYKSTTTIERKSSFERLSSDAQKVIIDSHKKKSKEYWENTQELKAKVSRIQQELENIDKKSGVFEDMFNYGAGEEYEQKQKEYEEALQELDYIWNEYQEILGESEYYKEEMFLNNNENVKETLDEWTNKLTKSTSLVSETQREDNWYDNLIFGNKDDEIYDQALDKFEGSKDVRNLREEREELLSDIKESEDEGLFGKSWRWTASKVWNSDRNVENAKERLKEIDKELTKKSSESGITNRYMKAYNNWLRTLSVDELQEEQNKQQLDFEMSKLFERDKAGLDQKERDDIVLQQKVESAMRQKYVEKVKEEFSFVDRNSDLFVDLVESSVATERDVKKISIALSDKNRLETDLESYKKQLFNPNTIDGIMDKFEEVPFIRVVPQSISQIGNLAQLAFDMDENPLEFGLDDRIERGIFESKSKVDFHIETLEKRTEGLRNSILLSKDLNSEQREQLQIALLRSKRDLAGSVYKANQEKYRDALKKSAPISYVPGGIDAEDLSMRNVWNRLTGKNKKALSESHDNLENHYNDYITANNVLKQIDSGKQLNQILSENPYLNNEVILQPDKKYDTTFNELEIFEPSEWDMFNPLFVAEFAATAPVQGIVGSTMVRSVSKGTEFVKGALSLSKYTSPLSKGIGAIQYVSGGFLRFGSSLYNSAEVIGGVASKTPILGTTLSSIARTLPSTTLISKFMLEEMLVEEIIFTKAYGQIGYEVGGRSGRNLGSGVVNNMLESYHGHSMVNTMISNSLQTKGITNVMDNYYHPDSGRIQVMQVGSIADMQSVEKELDIAKLEAMGDFKVKLLDKNTKVYTQKGKTPFAITTDSNFQENLDFMKIKAVNNVVTDDGLMTVIDVDSINLEKMKSSQENTAGTKNVFVDQSNGIITSEQKVGDSNQRIIIKNEYTPLIENTKLEFKKLIGTQKFTFQKSISEQEILENKQDTISLAFIERDLPSADITKGRVIVQSDGNVYQEMIIEGTNINNINSQLSNSNDYEIIGQNQQKLVVKNKVSNKNLILNVGENLELGDKFSVGDKNLETIRAEEPSFVKEEILVDKKTGETINKVETVGNIMFWSQFAENNPNSEVLHAPTNQDDYLAYKENGKTVVITSEGKKINKVGENEVISIKESISESIKQSLKGETNNVLNQKLLEKQNVNKGFIERLFSKSSTSKVSVSTIDSVASELALDMQTKHPAKVISKLHDFGLVDENINTKINNKAIETQVSEFKEVIGLGVEETKTIEPISEVKDESISEAEPVAEDTIVAAQTYSIKGKDSSNFVIGGNFLDQELKNIDVLRPKGVPENYVPVYRFVSVEEYNHYKKTGELRKIGAPYDYIFDGSSDAKLSRKKALMAFPSKDEVISGIIVNKWDDSLVIELWVNPSEVEVYDADYYQELSMEMPGFQSTIESFADDYWKNGMSLEEYLSYERNLDSKYGRDSRPDSKIKMPEVLIGEGASIYQGKIIITNKQAEEWSAEEVSSPLFEQSLEELAEESSVIQNIVEETKQDNLPLQKLYNRLLDLQLRRNGLYTEYAELKPVVSFLGTGSWGNVKSMFSNTGTLITNTWNKILHGKEIAELDEQIEKETEKIRAIEEHEGRIDNSYLLIPSEGKPTAKIRVFSESENKFVNAEVIQKNKDGTYLVGYETLSGFGTKSLSQDEILVSKGQYEIITKDGTKRDVMYYVSERTGRTSIDFEENGLLIAEDITEQELMDGIERNKVGVEEQKVSEQVVEPEIPLTELWGGKELVIEDDFGTYEYKRGDSVFLKRQIEIDLETAKQILEGGHAWSRLLFERFDGDLNAYKAWLEEEGITPGMMIDLTWEDGKYGVSTFHVPGSSSKEGGQPSESSEKVSLVYHIEIPAEKVVKIKESKTISKGSYEAVIPDSLKNKEDIGDYAFLERSQYEGEATFLHMVPKKYITKIGIRPGSTNIRFLRGFVNRIIVDENWRDDLDGYIKDLKSKMQTKVIKGDPSKHLKSAEFTIVVDEKTLTKSIEEVSNAITKTEKSEFKLLAEQNPELKEFALLLRQYKEFLGDKRVELGFGEIRDVVEKVSIDSPTLEELLPQSGLLKSIAGESENVVEEKRFEEMSDYSLGKSGNAPVDTQIISDNELYDLVISDIRNFGENIPKDKLTSSYVRKISDQIDIKTLGNEINIILSGIVTSEDLTEFEFHGKKIKFVKQNHGVTHTIKVGDNWEIVMNLESIEHMEFTTANEKAVALRTIIAHEIGEIIAADEFNLDKEDSQIIASRISKQVLRLQSVEQFVDFRSINSKLNNIEEDFELLQRVDSFLSTTFLTETNVYDKISEEYKKGTLSPETIKIIKELYESDKEETIKNLKEEIIFEAIPEIISQFRDTHIFSDSPYTTLTLGHNVKPKFVNGRYAEIVNLDGLDAIIYDYENNLRVQYDIIENNPQFNGKTKLLEEIVQEQTDSIKILHTSGSESSKYVEVLKRKDIKSLDGVNSDDSSVINNELGFSPEVVTIGKNIKEFGESRIIELNDDNTEFVSEEKLYDFDGKEYYKQTIKITDSISKKSFEIEVNPNNFPKTVTIRKFIIEYDGKSIDVDYIIEIDGLPNPTFYRRFTSEGVVWASNQVDSWWRSRIVPAIRSMVNKGVPLYLHRGAVSDIESTLKAQGFDKIVKYKVPYEDAFEYWIAESPVEKRQILTTTKKGRQKELQMEAALWQAGFRNNIVRIEHKNIMKQKISEALLSHEPDTIIIGDVSSILNKDLGLVDSKDVLLVKEIEGIMGAVVMIIKTEHGLKKLLVTAQPFGEDGAEYAKAIIEYNKRISKNVKVVFTGDSGAISPISKRLKDMNPELPIKNGNEFISAAFLFTPTEFVINGKVYRIKNPISDIVKQRGDSITLENGYTFQVRPDGRMIVANGANLEDVEWVTYNVLKYNPGAVDQETSHIVEQFVLAGEDAPELSIIMTAQDEVAYAGESIQAIGHTHPGKSEKLNIIFNHLFGNGWEVQLSPTNKDLEKRVKNIYSSYAFYSDDHKMEVQQKVTNRLLEAYETGEFSTIDEAIKIVESALPSNLPLSQKALKGQLLSTVENPRMKGEIGRWFSSVYEVGMTLDDAMELMKFKLGTT